MKKKTISIVMLFYAILTYGALDLYCDFEKKESGRTTDANGISGSFQQVEGPPQFVDETPEVLKLRSRQSLDLGKGFIWFRRDSAPVLDQDWSLSCYIKPDENAKGTRTVIFAPRAWSWKFNSETKSVVFAIADSSQKTVKFELKTIAENWQLWTLVKADGELHFYINGELKGTRKLDMPLPVANEFFIGAATSSGGHASFSAIDDLSLWSRALTAEEIATLATGCSPLDLRRPGVIERQKTEPFTEKNTQIYRLRREMDGSNAVIVPSDDKSGLELAGKVQQFLLKKWNILLPIRKVESHNQGSQNLFLVGISTTTALSRELTANQQINAITCGSELQVIPEAVDWKRGVVFLGGRNESEVLNAAEELVKRFPQPHHLKFTTAALYDAKVTEPDVPVKRAKQHYAGNEARKVNLTLDIYLKQAFENFRNTGDERHVAAFCQILDLLFNFYPADMAQASVAPTFEFHLFPQYLYFLENSDAFPDKYRIKAAEYTRSVMEKAIDSWELVMPVKSYVNGKQDYYTNHYIFAARAVASGARYLQSRFNYEPSKYFLAVAEHTFDGVRNCPLSPENAAGYQFLVYRIFTDYMLASGRFDQAMINSANYQEYLDYGKGILNHLGYTPGYGDGNPIESRGPFLMLLDAWNLAGDREALQLLSLIGRQLKKGPASNYYLDILEQWKVSNNLPIPERDRFDGLKTFTVNPVREKILKLPPSPFPKLDKAIFRSSWLPDAEFLAINGLTASPHGQDDATGISQYIAGSHLWLTEGDYIRRFAEDHNFVSVIRDGNAPVRLFNQVPEKERFAQVIGTVRNPAKNMAILHMLLSVNGVDYHRYIAWEDKNGFWVIDCLKAVQPGNYRFVSRWRTTGESRIQSQGLLAIQKPAPDDNGRYAFSISEGTGAASFVYAEFERSHGRGNGKLLSYPYSDGTVTTQMFWKDAELLPGESTCFVQYFRAVPGEKPRAVEVKKTGETTFRIESDHRSSAVRLSSEGISFTGNAGSLALPENAPLPESGVGTLVVNRAPRAVPKLETKAAKELASFDAQISASAGGSEIFALGLANGQVFIYDKHGNQIGKSKLNGEISAICIIPTPQGEKVAVGCRRPATDAILAGSLHLLESNGREVWSKELFPFRTRPGTPVTIFPAWIDGRDASPVIVAGTESWHYFLVDILGKDRGKQEVTHGATVGAAGDFNGDGKDEIYGGTEYFWHDIFDANGKRLSRTTTSPRDIAAAFGTIAANGGSPRLFAARSDGWLYSESLEAKHWRVNIGGPGYGIVILPEKIAVAGFNGHLTFLDENGKKLQTVTLPAPLTGLVELNGILYTSGLDGRVYAIDAKNGHETAVFSCVTPDAESLFLPKIFRSGEKIYASYKDRLFQITQ